MTEFNETPNLVAQLAILIAILSENEEKFERLEPENTTMRKKNAKLIIRIEALNNTPLPPLGSDSCQH